MSRGAPTTALARLAQVGPVLGALWLAQLLIGAQVGRAVQGAASAALGPYVWLFDGHLLAAVIELLVEHPAVGAAIAQAMTTALALGLALWLLFGGAVLDGLLAPGRPTASQSAAASVRWAGPLAAQTLWLGLVRGAILLGVGLVPSAGRPAAGAVAIALLAATVGPFDAARVAVVGGAGPRPWHPGHLVGALKAWPGRWAGYLGAAGLWLAAWAWALGSLVVLLSNPGSAGLLWLARLGAAVPIALGGLRLALAAQAAARTAQPEPAPSGSPPAPTATRALA